MNYPALDDLEKRTDCRYTLAVLAAKRAREINNGSELLVKSKSSKSVTNALEEINQGKISYTRGNTGIK
ncbi:DNA-directed RNA polymerase subunit omega [Dendrosporobacter sp. 1207_IL3150]|uniref:DNA-directed RNA polymerase subunit omega n=1 Tax=Dendrosporobacter sp. 1207_IL3150 TaxID=3084054 RepID=UPI002FD91ADE